MSSQVYQFRIKSWIEINDDPRATYNTRNQIRLKATMLKSSLCDYNGAYIFVEGTITINRAGEDDALRQIDQRDKQANSKIVHHSLTLQAK